MFRSRTTANAERASSVDCSGPDGEDSGGAAKGQEIAGRKLPRDESAEDEERRTRVRASDGERTSGRAAGGNGGLGSFVWRLAGLDVQHEYVFRGVVKFLYTIVENQPPIKRPWRMSLVCHTAVFSSTKGETLNMRSSRTKAA